MNETRAAQLFYTSCLRGLSGHAGFQTHSMSAGIEARERQEIESKALYQPPRDLSPGSESASFSDDCPKAFRSVILSSGRLALLRSVYSGKDYSGRWGNYFAHALVFDECIKDWWSIDAWSWSGWKSSLNDSETEECDPTDELPSALVSIPSEPAFSLKNLHGFLTYDNSRGILLQKMIDAVFASITSNRRIVIRETRELDGVFWVACVLKSFPTIFQDNLTYSTYQFDPRHCQSINIVIGDTDFTFDDHAFNHHFFVFDLADHRYSDLGGERTKYSRTMCDWLLNQPARIDEFNNFVLELGGHFHISELPHLLTIFCAEQSEKVVPEPGQISTTTDFILSHRDNSSFQRMFEAASGLHRLLDSKAPIDDWISTILLLAEGAMEPTSQADERRVCETWLAGFDCYLLANNDEIQQIIALRDDNYIRLGKNAEKIIEELFLSDNHLDRIIESVPKLSYKMLEILMRQIKALSIDDKTLHNDIRQQVVESVIENFLINKRFNASDDTINVEWLFRPFISDSKCIGGMIDHILYVLSHDVYSSPAELAAFIETCKEVGRCLANVGAHESDYDKAAIFREVESERGIDYVLVGEWEQSIERAKDRIKVHQYYEDKVLPGNTLFSSTLQDRMLEMLLKRMPENERGNEARRWLSSQRLENISNNIMSSVLPLVFEGVQPSIKDLKKMRLAENILQEVKKRRLEISLPIIELQVAISIASYWPKSKEKEKLAYLLDRMDRTNYEIFLKEFLPWSLSRADSETKHRVAICSAIGPRSEQRSQFTAAYKEWLFNRGFKNNDDILAIALVFWISLNDSDPEAWALLGKQRKGILTSIEEYVISMRRRRRLKLERYVKDLISEQEHGARVSLGKFFGRVRQRNEGLFRKLLGLRFRK